jgi:hypothetical protein
MFEADYAPVGRANPANLAAQDGDTFIILPSPMKKGRWSRP